MKFLRLSALILTCCAFSFGASKEMIELQRDVSLLQDKVDAMQRDLDTKLGALSAMIQATQDSSAKTNSDIRDTLTNGVGRQLAPITGLNTKVDTMSDEVRALKDALTDLSSRLERMDAKMTDLKNQMQIIQNPPAAPGAAGTPTTPAGGPPPGMSADKSYTDAVRDLQSGNIDLATQEFQQYLTYFPNTEYAVNAQYYLGQIAYDKGDYAGAVTAFDTVLERYPQNPKTATARLMKGMALLRSGQRNKAVQEFHALIQSFPRTEEARKAQQQLHALGLSATAPSTARKR